MKRVNGILCNEETITKSYSKGLWNRHRTEDTVVEYIHRKLF